MNKVLTSQITFGQEQEKDNITHGYSTMEVYQLNGKILEYLISTIHTAKIIKRFQKLLNFNYLSFNNSWFLRFFFIKDYIVLLGIIARFF